MTLPRELILGEVIDRIDWSDGLFSLVVNAPVEPYQAGQFLKLALQDDAGQWIRRAYSLVNSPNHTLGYQTFELLIIADPNGELTPLLNKLQPGDDVYVSRQAAGFMTVSEIPKTTKDLWLLSTGTAIGPFLSMLDEIETENRFERLVLVHAVRTIDELVYRDRIEQLLSRYSGKLCYVPIVSRETCDWALSGRIPQLISSGSLFNAVGYSFDVSRSFVYMCGNPSMVHDTATQLIELGLTKHLRRQAGQFSSENYW